VTTSYDQVAYSCKPQPQTHPDRLATLATLHGMTSEPVDACRVLEIGCNDGSNLIPLAFSEPRSQFTGIDLAQTAIDAAGAFSAELKLANVQFTHADVCHWDAAGREFDYIIAHGLYSWVPPAAREAILAICASRLSPNGVAYISYNALPGCHFRRFVWDLVRFHTRGIAEPHLKIEEARAIARRMMDRMGDAPHQAAIKEEFKTLLEASDSVLFHDDLAGVNTPLHLGEFVEAAARHGLQYLGDADYARDAVREPILGTGDWLAEREYADYATGRRFRSSLLCRRDVVLNRTMSRDRLEGLLAASPVEPEPEQPDGTQKFTIATGKTLSTNHPFARRALCELAARWPGCMPAASFLGSGEEAAAAVDMLLRLYESKSIELRTRMPRLVASVSERPVASALARLQLARGGTTVTNQRHTAVELTDELSQRLLVLMDGSRDRAALLAALSDAAEAGAAPAAWRGHGLATSADLARMIEERLDANLALAARLCLLVA
jgi:SAM-dependent methyltransferase